MSKQLIYFSLLIALLSSCKQVDTNQSLQYKVGILGAPSSPNVEWNDKNMELMKEFGFNTMQLNIA